MFVLQTAPIDPRSYYKTTKPYINGALATFEGIVRSDKHNNKEVASILYIADETACRLEGDTIIEETLRQYSITRAVCVQRIGVVCAGETAVWIGAWSAHRDDSFKGCRYLIEEIKKRLLIWKKEYFTDGSSEWVRGCQTSIII